MVWYHITRPPPVPSLFDGGLLSAACEPTLMTTLTSESNGRSDASYSSTQSSQSTSGGAASTEGHTTRGD